MDNDNEQQIEKGIQTLTNNNIKQFIIRIDLAKNSIADCQNFVDHLSAKFNSDDKVFEQQNSSDFLGKPQLTSYVLKRKNGTVITYSIIDNAIIFETLQYYNRDIYEPDLALIIETLHEKNVQVRAKRLGMRFINSFPCYNTREISRIFIPRYSKHIKESITDDSISRFIVVEDFTYDNYKVKLQYGVPNKFYPAKLSNYDLLLDIDTYYDGITNIDEWSGKLIEFNHSSYNLFVSMITQTLLNKMR